MGLLDVGRGATTGLLSSPDSLRSQRKDARTRMGRGAPPWGRDRPRGEGPIERARRIANEELARTFKLAPGAKGHNNRYDAERHARWVYRMAKEGNPFLASAISTGHELKNLLEGSPLREIEMDMYNNGVGLTAALAGRSIPRRDDPEFYILPQEGGR